MAADTDGTTTGDNVMASVIAHCEDHRTHKVGCLDCAAEECARTDLDLGDFLGHMERVGWPDVNV